VAFLEEGNIHMGINLGCGNIRVSQKLLYRTEIRPAGEKFRGITMPQGMEGRGNPCQSRQFHIVFPYSLSGKAFPRSPNKQGRRTDLARQAGPGVGQIPFKPESGFFPKRYQPFFISLSHYPGNSFGKINILYIKKNSLGNPEACGIDKLKQGPIPKSSGIIYRYQGKHPVNPFPVKNRRQMEPSFRGFQNPGGVIRAEPLIRHMPKKGPEGGDRFGHGPGIKAVLIPAGVKVGHEDGTVRLLRRQLFLFQPFQKTANFNLIGFRG
jgi:hypothetical protein